MPVSVQKSKKKHVCKKDDTWNPSTCTFENGEYLASIINDSAITYDEIIEATITNPTKTVPTKSILTNFNEKKVT